MIMAPAIPSPSAQTTHLPTQMKPGASMPARQACGCSEHDIYPTSSVPCDHAPVMLLCCTSSRIWDHALLIIALHHTAHAWESSHQLCLSHDAHAAVLLCVAMQRASPSGLQGRIGTYSFGGQPLGPKRIWLQNHTIPGLTMTRSIGDCIGATIGVTAEPELVQYEVQPLCLSGRAWHVSRTPSVMC